MTHLNVTRSDVLQITLLFLSRCVMSHVNKSHHISTCHLTRINVPYHIKYIIKSIFIRVALFFLFLQSFFPRYCKTPLPTSVFWAKYLCEIARSTLQQADYDGKVCVCVCVCVFVCVCVVASRATQITLWRGMGWLHVVGSLKL